ncbi:MAG TPA: FAD-dependent oxidoreductase [Azospirillaceae bacterium]|nr:FAD-dependent oxidoreductase [Azospirillaceae bacterium]
MTGMMARRRVLAGAGALAGMGMLGGCAGRSAPAKTPALQLPPMRVTPDRISHITVCTRPFRAQGPRLELERVGAKTVLHHYGHGGSGWSLSWGAGEKAAALALGTGAREIGVIGCGAMGLTTALLLQRAGARVTIYAREFPPHVASAYASGVWSPDSRIALEQHATPSFKADWEAMTRRSFAAFQGLLGLADAPVEWIDSYVVRDRALSPPVAEDRPRFAELRRELVPDLSVGARDYEPGDHPFGDRTVRRVSFMMYNLAAYGRMLMADFLAAGGRTERREFHSPAELAALPQPLLVNCTGYGAKALFGDVSLTPVRGQIAHVATERGPGHGLYYDQVSFVPRRDGLVFQKTGANDYYGFGDDSTAPDRAEAEEAVRTIGRLYATSSS